ncbi:MAG: ASCH domain-containing protein [Nanoarchaeota archaeon]
MDKILYLTLKKKWFDLISSGEKKIEYREIKPYWTKRLFDNGNSKKFDFIIFKNGYTKNSPKIKVEFLGITKNKMYEILLGGVLKE